MTTILATLLRWAGGALAGALIASGACSAADALSQHTGTVPVQFADATGVAVLEIYSAGGVAVKSTSSAPEHLRRPGEIGFAATTFTGFASAEVTSERRDDVLRLTGSCGFLVSGQCRTDLEVAVPDGVRVIVRSEGELSVRGIRASGVAVDAAAGTSRVEVLEVSGDVRARSNTAEVRVSSITGKVDAASNTEPVRVDGVAGSCAVRTDTSKIEIRGVTGDVDARSDTGDVTVFATAGQPAARLDIGTDTGRPTVAAATDPAGTRSVTIRSDTGDVAYLGS